MRAAHSAKAASQNEFSLKRAAEMLAPGSGESFKCPLHNSLATDVNPRAGSHLSVHRQTHSFESVELGVVVPLANEIRVRDQNTRRFIVCSKFPDWFP